MADPLAPVLPLVGTWRGDGTGRYPTIQPFSYTEEITFSKVPGKPFLAYSSRTRHGGDGRPLHGEVGWLRYAGDGRVELVVAQGPGLVEIVEGVVAAGGGRLDLVSTLVGGSTSAKTVTATARTYTWSGDELRYDLSMAAVGETLQPHLSARLARVTP